MSSVSIPSKDRTILILLGIIGAISLGYVIMNDDALHSRFWSNFLHNSVFFTGIALMSIFFVCVSVTAYAGWNAQFKRVWEAMSHFLIVGFVLMLIVAIGNYLGWHHLYHWTDDHAVHSDKILHGKSSFLNKNWYAIGGLGIVAVWIFFAWKIRSLSTYQDDHGTSDFTEYKNMKFWAAIFLPVAGFSMAAVIWLWLMSIDAHWYSTMFAWYTGASWFVSMIAFTILLLIYLKSRGYYKSVNMEHFHDLGKFMFAFSIFWTYLWFSQYMLIWYANIGEETVYFKTRIKEYPILFYGNLIVNFVLPFLILMRNDTKRKYGSLILVSIIVLLGHWVDFFMMIKPGVLHTAHEAISHASVGTAEAGQHSATTIDAHAATASHAAHASSFTSGFTIPGIPEFGMFLGFLALFVATTLHFLSKAQLTPKNDPFIHESYHHHT